MNVYAILLALVCFIALTIAQPTYQSNIGTSTFEDTPSVDGVEDIPTNNEDRHVRLGRATCDLLSMSTPWGSANHSLCAAHCLAMGKGFRGGRCIDGVCNCRR